MFCGKDGMIGLLPISNIAVWNSSSSGQGRLAVSISMIVHPRDQMSVFHPYSRDAITSGLIQKTVPHIEWQPDVDLMIWSSFDPPKSASLQFLLLSRRMLAHLISRCIIFLDLCKYTSPSRICRQNLLASFSERAPFVDIQSQIDLPSIYSINIATDSSLYWMP